MLDAKPGASYVIKRESGELTINASFHNKGPGEIFYIEDETTGTLAVGKTSSVIFDNANRYKKPSGSGLSTIGGTKGSRSSSTATAYVQSIDGDFVDGEGPASLLTGGEQPRIEYPIPLAPGVHPLGIMLVSHVVTGGSFPILFDAKPDRRYVVKSEAASMKRWNGKMVLSFTFWIEDASSGAIAYPRTDAPIHFYN